MAKRVIRLTESDLMDLVKECVTYFHQPTNTYKTITHYSLLSDSMTEDVTYGKYARNECIYENINEGLIMSYDINRSAVYLKKKFPNISGIRSLRFNPYKRRQPAYYRPKNNDFVSIGLETNFSNFREISDYVETLFGWFTSEVFIHEEVPTGFIPREFYNFNGDFICQQLNNITLEDYLAQVRISRFNLIIEAKFGERYEPSEEEVFYHATERNELKKILAQGLCPTSYGNFPERVYLGRSISEIKDMVQSNLKDMVIFQVDVSGLNLYHDESVFSEEHKRYIDVVGLDWYRDEGNPIAVYTYDNIPPSHIHILSDEEALQQH